MRAQVHISVAGLQTLAASVQQGLTTQAGGATGGVVFRRMLKQWGVRYLEFTRRRYMRLSRSGGGGEWPPLSPVTIARRREGRPGSSRVRDPVTRRFVQGAGRAAILVDTGSLIAALNIGAPGSLFKHMPGGALRVGFAPTGHPGEGAMTFAEIATIHNFGRGRIPARPILVAPDQTTIAGMRSDARRAVSDALRIAAERARRRG
jgi:hypothetical protein